MIFLELPKISKTFGLELPKIGTINGKALYNKVICLHLFSIKGQFLNFNQQYLNFSSKSNLLLR